MANDQAGTSRDLAWYNDIAHHVRDLRGANDEGAIWVVLLVDPPAVLIAITRWDGEPLPVDWRVWEAMRGRFAVSRSELVDLVVGDRSWWAAQAGRRDFAA